MAWTEPVYSRGNVDRAGAYIVANADLSGEEFDIAEWNHNWDVINNWRSSHSYPLHVLKMTLKGRAKSVDAGALVAQRLKRFYSVFLKLNRNEQMKLSQMQDIGGCRAILNNVRDAEKLVAVYKAADVRNSRQDRPIPSRQFDYINNPKPDGYRSVHLVYKYQSGSSARRVFNGHRIEIQVRSRLQHAWATAVETVDIATSQALKSNVGEEKWKRFFALMGSAIALRERRPLVPGTPTERSQLSDEIRHLADSLNVEGVLAGIGTALETSTQGEGDDEAFLLVLDATGPIKQIAVTGYRRDEMARAQNDYSEIEKTLRGAIGSQAVLVSVDSLDSLATAYPNFFLDTQAFLKALRITTAARRPQMIARVARRPRRKK
jgi:ppGpp synthetase/RelA/SpoT-type nucleotidyltranferase